MQHPPSRVSSCPPHFISETVAAKTWAKAAKYPPPVAAIPHCWKEGDIAFLRPSKTFSPEELRTLIHRTPEFPRGYIPVRATGHPVIILRRLSQGSTHVLVTTVSAHNSGPENGYLAPWKQACHRHEALANFRSFEGSQRATAEFPPLFLRPGQEMRKPRTSWVHIQSAWVVPVSVLGHFSGVKGAHVVTMTTESLDNLRAHMAARCRVWGACQQRLLAVEKTSPAAGAVLSSAVPSAAFAVVASAAAAVSPSPSFAPAALRAAVAAGRGKLPVSLLSFGLPPTSKNKQLKKDKVRKPREENWQR
ncbi:hypothetical protein CHGG_04182 [Chaetomium globosum CBS 148.51]|uniref:Uncharacterized protein n=1 Tax=Chaetomium globosum (strain ATCC 6205 / CBS 148.51 / DSM 1962 / NBRC 6347 / NRRL 1970) TaxID=306901 RepID=Q2H214_CHAGB|nr:uncharacterized protein CHGG_04182 [Chaetomium globosum CBS 148.51]EAQ87563.1 hypothetical protein CHGG_04182 [Chaetomium globosum CBS 148.51]